MRRPTILITAAAGKTGSATAKLLLQKGYPVRALVRRADVRSEQLRALGAEVAVGSLEDIADLRASLAGVQRAYFCPPLEYGTLRRATLFAAAAQEAELEAVVVLSQWLADPLHPAVHAREKWLTHRVFEWIPGVDITTVNPGFFADNYLVALEPIAQFGLMAMPLGDGLNAPPSNEDIARVVVGALADPARHAGKVYRPTGPRLLAPDEIAAAIGTALDWPVRYQNAPMALFLKVAKSLGVSDFAIEELHWFLLDYQRNSFGVGAPTDAVLEVGGAQPESFEEIARRYVAASPFAKRTLGSRLRAVGNLVKGLLTPAPDPEATARRLEIPKPAHTALAADSSEWNRSHTTACRAAPGALELR